MKKKVLKFQCVFQSADKYDISSSFISEVFDHDQIRCTNSYKNTVRCDKEKTTSWSSRAVQLDCHLYHTSLLTHTAVHSNPSFTRDVTKKGTVDLRQHLVSSIFTRNLILQLLNSVNCDQQKKWPVKASTTQITKLVFFSESARWYMQYSLQCFEEYS